MGFIVASSKAELLQTIRQRVRELVDPKELDAVVQCLQIQRRMRLFLRRGITAVSITVCTQRYLLDRYTAENPTGTDDPFGCRQ